MKIGVLTGGGDAPGLNAAIRAIVKDACRHHGDEVLGIKYGWAGLINEKASEEDRVIPLTLKDVSGILIKGGTIIGASRTNPLERRGGMKALKRNFEKFGLDALIAIGGEDTLGVAYKAFLRYGLPVVGVPKTIDNDLWETDSTIGFNTACHIATEYIDRLHSTAESHNRVEVVEVMGRHTGWIAIRSGMAGGADAILIPEFPLTIDTVCEIIQQRIAEGKKFSIIVVSEGYKLDGKLVVQSGGKDAFGHEELGGVSAPLSAILEEKLNKKIRRKDDKIEVKPEKLGRVQRGGIPNTYDRVLATRLGLRAVDLVHNHQFGRMAAIKGYDIVDVELKSAVGAADEERRVRTVPKALFETATRLFG